MPRLPRGWTRTNRDARYATTLFELQVRRQQCGTAYDVLVHTHAGVTLIFEDVDTELKAMNLAIVWMRNEVNQVLKRMK